MENDKDLNKSQSVADKDLTAQSVTESSVSGSAGGQQDAAVLADGTNQDKDVPYGRFKEANEAKKVAEEARLLAEQKLQQANDQMALIHANQPQLPAQTAPLSTYEQAVKDLGLVETEYMSEAERAQVMRRTEQLSTMKAQQQQAAFADQQFARSHPDFGPTVGQVGLSGQFVASVELQKILMEKPHLRASCNTAAGAYQVVVDERKLEELTQKAQIADQQKTQREVDAKTGPMSPAAAGGGAVDRSGGLITQTSTAADVLKLKGQVEAGEFD